MIRAKLLTILVFCSMILAAGTGSASDEGLFYLSIIGLLSAIVGLLYLGEFIYRKLVGFLSRLVDHPETDFMIA